jgi:tripartite ATP-independent transporter DctM subunit
MDVGSISLICTSVLCALIFVGCPIFVSLGTSSLVGIFLLEGLAGISRVPAVIFTHLDNFVFLAIPLFLLMGQILFFSGIGSDLYIAGSKWLSGLRGQLAMGSIVACGIFGAMSGVSVAGAACIGSFAIPEMIKAKYHQRVAAGTVAAAGALAMLIPPSILFIIYGGMTDVSVGKLFIGGIIPGIILVLLMCAWVWIWVKRSPDMAPDPEMGVSWKERFASLKRLWTALVLMFLALGTIYLGVCTPTEAGAIGAGGALLIAFFIYRSITWEKFRQIFHDATRTTAAVMLIVACGTVFSVLLAALRIPDIVAEFAVTSGLPNWGIIILLNLSLILLGMFVDAGTAIVITTPIVLPTIVGLGYDPLWWGIVLTINLEMAVITPPVGLNLYVIKSIAPDIPMGEIIRGALPFLIVECLCLAIFIIFQDLTLWLPSRMG